MSFGFEVWDWVYLVFVFAGLYAIWVLSSRYVKNDESDISSPLERSEMKKSDNEYQ